MIEIDTPYFTGLVPALCMEKPVYDLIIGNTSGAREPTDPDLNWAPKYDQNQPEIERKTGATVVTRSQSKAENKALKKLNVMPQIDEMINATMLSEEQQNDPSLKKVRELAECAEEKVSKRGDTHRYIKTNGIIYREYKSSNGGF